MNQSLNSVFRLTSISVLPSPQAFLCPFIVCLLTMMCLPSESFGQAANRRQAPKNAQAEGEVEPPETVTLMSKIAPNSAEKSVQIKATFYQGEKSKETVPVILLHDWEGNRKDMDALGKHLQEKYKFSVIAPDLRGHGESLTISGVDRPIELKKFKKNDMATLLLDIERCKQFLMKKNNAGELNIEMLTVIAVGKMAVHAVQWSITDWSWDSVGGLKQGKDVKAVMLVSPERKLKGLNMSQNLKNGLFTGRGGKPLAVYLAWSANHKTSDREGKSIDSVLSKPRSKLPIPMYQLREPYNTNLNPTELISNPKHTVVFDDIATFVKTNIVANKDVMPWQNREKK